MNRRAGACGSPAFVEPLDERGDARLVAVALPVASDDEPAVALRHHLQTAACWPARSTRTGTDLDAKRRRRAGNERGTGECGGHLVQPVGGRRAAPGEVANTCRWCNSSCTRALRREVTLSSQNEGPSWAPELPTGGSRAAAETTALQNTLVSDLCFLLPRAARYFGVYF